MDCEMSKLKIVIGIVVVVVIIFVGVMVGILLWKLSIEEGM